MRPRWLAFKALPPPRVLGRALAASAWPDPLRDSAASGACACRGWQDGRLRSEHFGQCIMPAALLPIGCAARAATHADSTDQLIVNDDRQAAFLNCQAELVHPDQRRNVIECAISQHMGGLASEKCGARLVLGGLLIDVGLTIHPMLMDNLAVRVEYHDRRRAAVRFSIGFANVRKPLC